VYWRSGQYEGLRRRDPQARQRILREAVGKYGRSYTRRFTLILAGVVATAIWMATRRSWMNASPWRVAAVAVGAGVFLYGYLLWEINGTIRRAVERYLSERRDR
jgi:fucose 4-O-acetylase-like acetyltransferase